MSSLKPDLVFARELLANGWNGEEFAGSKRICASLLLVSYTALKLDRVWFEEEFEGRDFDAVWDQFRRDVEKEFIHICLAEMQ